MQVDADSLVLFSGKNACNCEIQISCKYDLDLLNYLNALFFVE